MSFAINSKVTSVKKYLDNSVQKGIKYASQSGAKHRVYFPSTELEVHDDEGNVVKELVPVAIEVRLHEWKDRNGDFRCVACSDGYVEQTPDGNYINDGSCPMCGRVRDSWDIYKMEYAEAEPLITSVGEQREKDIDALKKRLLDNAKAKDARNYMYILTAVFKMDNDKPILGEDKLPEFELKVMKLSNGRTEKFIEVLTNSCGKTDLTGAELIISYPKMEDAAQRVGQSTVAPIFETMISKYPGLKDKIDSEVNAFTWESAAKSLKELSYMPNNLAKAEMDKEFDKYDEFKKKQALDPNVKYIGHSVAGDDNKVTIESKDVENLGVGGSIPDPNEVFKNGGVQI